MEWLNWYQRCGAAATSRTPSPQSPVVTVALLCCPHHLFPYGSVINGKYVSFKYFVPIFKYYPSTCEIWKSFISPAACSLPLASRHLLQIMKRNLQKIAACKFLAVSQGREIPNNGLADRTVKSWYLFMCRVRWPRFICVNNVMHRKCHITLGWPCHGRAASRGHSAAGTGPGFCFIKRLQIIFN